MSLLILDPNLTDENGHHLAYDLALAGEAARRQQTTTILANARFIGPASEHASIIPFFNKTSYPQASHDVTKTYENFVHLNDLLRDELVLLPRNQAGAADMVLVPTVSEYQLLGYVSWMKTFDAASAPLFVIHLMLPSGLGDANKPPINPLSALFYSLAFRTAKQAGAEILFYAGSHQHAEEFSRLAGYVIEAHPSPISPPTPSARPLGDIKHILLSAGDLKIDKGAKLLPGLVEVLASRWPDHKFTIQANPNTAEPNAKQVLVTLAKLADRFPNFALLGKRLDEDAYLDLLGRADLVVFAYDQQAYARKSSGVLWESISLARPLVAPRDTWLYREAVYWGAGVVGYETFTIESVASATEAAIKKLPALTKAARKASQHYRKENGAVRVFDQLGLAWAERIVTAQLIEPGRNVLVSLAEVNEPGWLDAESFGGQIVRWAQKQPELVFNWPWDEPWRLQIKVSHFFGEDQLRGITAVANAQPCRVSYERTSAEAGIIFIAAPEGAVVEQHYRTQINLPYTYMPPHETRELGILVSGIEIAPAYVFEDGEGVGKVRIRSQIKASNEGYFPFSGILSGTLVSDPRKAAILAFTIVNGEPAVVRNIGLFVNGIDVRLDANANPDRSWRLSGLISPAVLSRGGLASTWDLTTPGHERLDLYGLRLVEALQGYSARPMPRAQPPAPQPPVENSPPTGPIVLPDLPLAVVGDESLGNDFSYLHFQISGLLTPNGTRPHFTVKLFTLVEYAGLEIREGDGAFAIFEAGPPAGWVEDNWGRAIQLQCRIGGDDSLIGDLNMTDGEQTSLISILEAINHSLNVAAADTDLSATPGSGPARWLDVTRTLMMGARSDL